MNRVDVAIVAIVAFGVFLGWTRGLLGPLIAEGAFLLGYWVLASHPDLASMILPAGMPRPLGTLGVLAVTSTVVGFAGRMVLGVALRLPLGAQADKLLGAVVHGALGGVVVYVFLLGIGVTDKVLTPINGVASVGTVQIAAIQKLLATYPQAGMMVDAGELTRLSTATQTQGVPVGQLGQYAGVISWYERELRPELADSRLAPLMVKLGAQLPVIGQPVTLPSPAKKANP